MSAPAEGTLGGDKATGSSEEHLQKEHALELQRQYKAKKRKVIGCVFAVPLALLVLGILSGVIVIADNRTPESCAEISDRALCEASAVGCCYNGITQNCTGLDMCDGVCRPGFESYANLGVEPCIECEPGWADTDQDPTTPCYECDPGTFAGTGSVECALCSRGTADTDRNAATMYARLDV